MKVYLAGPMTGKPAYNVEAFESAAALLRALGHDVITPHELNAMVWQSKYGRPFDPYTDKADYGDPILRRMIAHDVFELTISDAIALLPGWEQSRGARIEVLIAQALGLTVLDALTGEERGAGVLVNASWTVDRRGTISRFLDKVEEGSKRLEGSHGQG